MQKVSFDKYLDKAYQTLPGGAFLTVKNGDDLNTMTIGWGSIGIIWGKEIFQVLVRKSRYTYQLIENTDQFTVSFPFDGKMKKELKFCGTKSGRDFDKFKECNLNIISSREIDTPIIGGCDLHYECVIKFKQDMDENYLIPEIKKSCYAKGDYHTIYFGEIVDCYLEN